MDSREKSETMKNVPKIKADKELRQQIKDALWGGIDPDGSTDTDRILALVDKAVVAELEKLLPQMDVKEYGVWVRVAIKDRLTQLGAKE